MMHRRQPLLSACRGFVCHVFNGFHRLLLLKVRTAIQIYNLDVFKKTNKTLTAAFRISFPIFFLKTPTYFN